MSANVIGVAQTTLSIGAQLNVLIRSYLAMPVLKITDSTVIPDVWTAGGVRIEPIEYSTEYVADVSEQLLVNVNGGKNFLSDNIAPRPRSWHITGYIPSDLVPDVLAQAAKSLGGVVPGIGLAAGYLGVATEIANYLMPSLKSRQSYLEGIFYSRKVFQFKTRDNEVVNNAVISNMTIDRKAESQNKLGIKLVVREIKILTATSIGADTISSPSGGIANDADAISAGSTSATSASSPVGGQFGPLYASG
jgi:hypothetical protein